MYINSINNVHFGGVWKKDGWQPTPKQEKIALDIQGTLTDKDMFGRSTAKNFEKLNYGFLISPTLNKNTVKVHLVDEGELPYISKIIRIGKYSKTGQFKTADIKNAMSRNKGTKLAAIALFAIGIIIAYTSRFWLSDNKDLEQNHFEQQETPATATDIPNDTVKVDF